MPKPIAALLATVAVALVLAPAAPAAEPVAVAYRPDLAQTPVLAGDRVLWIDGIVALDVFGAPAAGGRAGKLISAGADWPRPLSLAASPTRAALAFQEDSAPDGAGRQEYVYSRLLAGPSAGPLAFRGGSPDDASVGRPRPRRGHRRRRARRRALRARARERRERPAGPDHGAGPRGGRRPRPTSSRPRTRRSGRASAPPAPSSPTPSSARRARRR